MGAGLRGPVGTTAAEVLHLAAVLGVVLVRDAGAHVRGVLDVLRDGAAYLALRAAISFRHAQSIGDVRPCLDHLVLPVRPVVGAGRAEGGDRLDASLLGTLDEGLGGHAGHGLQAEASHVGGQAWDGARLVVLAGVAVTGGHVDGHVLQRLYTQLRVVVDPVLGAEVAPHLLCVVAVAVVGGVCDGLRHTVRGRVQVAGERGNELPHLWEALCQVHCGGAAHGKAGDGAIFVGTPTLAQHGGQLLGQEGLPLIVLAVFRLLPVGVEGGLAADGQNHVDVAVCVLGGDVSGQGPAGLILAGAQAVEGPHGRELAVRLGVPVASQQDLHLNRLARHGGGVDEDVCPALGDPLDTIHAHALRQALQGLLGNLARGALRNAVRVQVAGAGARSHGATEGTLGGSGRHQRHGQCNGKRQSQDRRALTAEVAAVLATGLAADGASATGKVRCKAHSLHSFCCSVIVLVLCLVWFSLFSRVQVVVLLLELRPKQVPLLLRPPPSVSLGHSLFTLTSIALCGFYRLSWTFPLAGGHPGNRHP